MRVRVKRERRGDTGQALYNARIGADAKTSGRPSFSLSFSDTAAVRLKQLRLSGFKSFADTTVIEFPGAVAGIVGPNGCGKSNVIDAIRWVLGEARVSELRGSTSMSELIFSGSMNRPASSRASVELVLDNSDGTIKGAWGRYTELSIKRIVTRDGSNAYLINNQQVRRRDVQDIFMGTGLGPRSYAIISQGMISNFIKAKPEELRVYLEEAAGVSKYKERRKETESALASTRDNLEKVRYLQETKRVEIERLTGEAQVAARWKELTDDKERTELLWYYLQECDAKTAVDKVNAKIAEREADLLESRGAVQKLTIRIEELKEEARVKREAADAAREAAWQVNKRVTELQGAIERIVTEKDSLAREISATFESISRRKNERDSAAGRIAELTAKAQELTETAEGMNEELAVAQEELSADLEEVDRRKQVYEKARAEAAAKQSRIDVLSVQMQALSREANQAETRLEALQGEVRAQRAPDEERLSALTELIEEGQARVEELSAGVEEQAEALRELRRQYDEARSQKEKLATEHARTAARLQAMENLQQKAQAEGKLPAWLTKMGLATAARVYEKLTVAPDWSVALEAVLSVRSAAIGVGALQRSAGFEYDPPPARLVFYERTAPQPSPSPSREGLVPLFDRVTSTDEAVTAALKVWLAGVWTAESLEEAIAQRGKLAAGERFVTAKGHIVDAVSVSFWAEESETAGVVSRAAEIRTLTENANSERDALDRLDESLIALQGQVRQAEMGGSERAKEAEAERSRLHTLQVEYTGLTAQVVAWKDKSRRTSEEMAELKTRLEELAAGQEQANMDFEEADLALSHAQEAVMEAKVSLEAGEQRAVSRRETVSSLESRLQMLRLEARTSQERIREAHERRAGADEEIESLTAHMEELAARRESLDESAQREGLTRVLQEVEAKNEAHKAAEIASKSAEDALEEARTRSSDLNAAQTPLLQEIADLKVRRESWLTQSTVFTERLNAAAADRAALERVVKEEGLKLSGLKTRVAKLTQEIEALGPVNHAALENLEHSRRAMEETERQIADLQEAIANLEASIRKIDAETRELLRGTFDEVNRHFAEMFTGLFGGGSARLTMSGDDILEAGVEVTAQPPGKRNASVKLLSGGEQAMTATALVFAIFRLNPAPFCLLDEVDAPLDEANQDRLARRILQMSANTQFMMITHHRVTMEHLRTLVGVTMKEPGVSRVVSVDVEQATEMAAQ